MICSDVYLCVCACVRVIRLTCSKKAFQNPLCEVGVKDSSLRFIAIHHLKGRGGGIHPMTYSHSSGLEGCFQMYSVGVVYCDGRDNLRADVPINHVMLELASDPSISRKGTG